MKGLHTNEKKCLKHEVFKRLHPNMEAAPNGHHHACEPLPFPRGHSS